MKIKIIQIGKNKDSYIDDAVNEYLKRLQNTFKIEIVTLKEVSASKTFSAIKCKNDEGIQILKNISENNFVIALDENGQMQSSEVFAGFIKSKWDMGQKIVFIIGGPYGLSDDVKNRADKILSLSKMTFTHQMIRIFLIEQLYRASCIFLGKEYHIA